MQWIQLNTKDLEHYLAAPQLKAAQSIACASTHAKPVEHAIARITQLIRTEVAANTQNTLNSNPASIPAMLESSACALIIEMLQSRLPSMKLTADQARNAQNARILLRRIARGELPLTQADKPSTTTQDRATQGEIPPPYVQYRSRTTTLSRKALCGL